MATGNPKSTALREPRATRELAQNLAEGALKKHLQFLVSGKGLAFLFLVFVGGRVGYLHGPKLYNWVERAWKVEYTKRGVEILAALNRHEDWKSHGPLLYYQPAGNNLYISLRNGAVEWKGDQVPLNGHDRDAICRKANKVVEAIKDAQDQQRGQAFDQALRKKPATPPALAGPMVVPVAVPYFPSEYYSTGFGPGVHRRGPDGKWATLKNGVWETRGPQPKSNYDPGLQQATDR